MTSRRWCFTLNNYIEDDEVVLSNFACNYMVYGREFSGNGTPHLQGFLILTTPKRLSGVQRILSRAHWEMARGDDSQASDYCKKDGDFTERGVLTSQGQRTDLSKIYSALADGMDEIVLAETYPEQYSRYYKAFQRYKTLKENTKKKTIPNHELRDWQQTLKDEFTASADDRTILFVIDYEGNKGKSWFCMHCFNTLSGCQLIDPGKKADMAYELKQDTRILLIDCARSRTDVLDYHFIEKVKDGVVFSPKYESTTKFLQHSVHVVVFMNCEPDPEKLSEDRYRYLHL